MMTKKKQLCVLLEFSEGELKRIASRESINAEIESLRLGPIQRKIFDNILQESNRIVELETRIKTINSALVY